MLWLHHNNLTGTLPPELGAMHSLLSLDVRYNPYLCGALPPSLHVDWDWQWDNPGHDEADESWYGYCDKAATENSACG